MLLVTEYKNYQIKTYKESPTLCYIVTAGRGGKIPDCLNGMYTSRSLAQKDIDKYLETKVKDTKDGEAGAKS